MSEIKIPVLDKGFVRFKEDWVLGANDLEVVNSARISFNRESNALTDADIRLIKYLAEHGHTSPFRHSVIKFHVKAPLMVCRQWWKYIIGSGHDESLQSPMEAWNEVSRRYVSTNNEYYLPSEWRLAAENNKQGSITGINPELNDRISEKYGEHLLHCEQLYNEALADGIAPEMARLFLPSNALYTEWYWTTSLQSAAHFIVQRMHEGAQVEIQEYARAILVIMGQLMPESIKVLVNE